MLEFGHVCNLQCDVSSPVKIAAIYLQTKLVLRRFCARLLAPFESSVQLFGVDFKGCTKKRWSGLWIGSVECRTMSNRLHSDQRHEDKSPAINLLLIICFELGAKPFDTCVRQLNALPSNSINLSIWLFVRTLHFRVTLNHTACYRFELSDYRHWGGSS